MSKGKGKGKAKATDREPTFEQVEREEYREQVADRISEMIAVLRRTYGRIDEVSQEVRDEAKVLARATLIFGGHLMDELGLRYEENDEWAWKRSGIATEDEINESLSKSQDDGTIMLFSKGKLSYLGNVNKDSARTAIKTIQTMSHKTDGTVPTWKDGTVLYVEGEKPKAIGNVKENASKIVSVIDKLSAGSIKGVDNDKTCRTGETGKSDGSLNEYVNERITIERHFTERGFVVSDVRTVRNIEHCWTMTCICTTPGKSNLARFELPYGWYSSATRAECIKDASKYNGCWKVQLYVMCNSNAYADFCMYKARANKFGMSIEEYMK